MTRRHFPGHDHHSLVHDLHTLALSRRRVLHFLGGAVLIPLVGTIFPGCYAGRWPHLHFEVYPSLAVATRGTSAAATSQIAVPKAACDEVYATTAYASSATNLPRVSLATDLVFSDGVSLETPTISGSPAAGYALAMQVAI